MRVYIPTPNKKNAACYILSVIGGGLLLIASAIAPRFGGLIRLASLGLWAFGFWVLYRYLLVCFYYVLDGESLRIVKVIGQKQEDAYSVSMRKCRLVKRLDEAKDRPRAHERFDFCRNFAPAEKYVCFFESDGASAEIIFEPSAEFAELMNASMALFGGELAEERENGYDE